jgi:hypothetical protein
MVRLRMIPFMGPASGNRRDPELTSELVARENLLSRSIVSAAFSLIEAFLSGLFFYLCPYEISRETKMRRWLPQIRCQEGERTA